MQHVPLGSPDVETGNVGGGSRGYTRVPTADGGTASGGSLAASSSQHELLRQQQERLLLDQDRQLGEMSLAAGGLRDVSERIGGELDEQAVMLDEFGAEMEEAETKLDATMRKMSKVLHMSNDRRQWMALGGLSSAIVLILMIIFAL